MKRATRGPRDARRRRALLLTPYSHTPRFIAVCTLAACILAAAAAPTEAAEIDLTSDSIYKLVGLNPGDELGWSLAIGDIDGDGILELAAGAPGAGAHAGAVYVLSIDELAAREHGLWEDRAIRIEHHIPTSRFGSVLLFMDVDNDGNDELIVGAPESAPQAEIRTGQVFVFDLPAAEGSLRSSDASTVIAGDESGDGFGGSLESCDIDGDGRAELLVAAPGGDDGSRVNAGIVYAIPTERMMSARAHRAADVAVGAVSGSGAGDALRTVRAVDVDGDGTAELVLGAHQFDPPKSGGGGTGWIEDAGTIYIVPSHDLITGMPLRSIAVDEIASAHIYGVNERAFVGHAIAVGDIDGDGTGDMVVSAHAAGRSDGRYSARGSAFILFGDRDAGTTGLPDRLESEPPAGSRHARAVTLRGRSMWDIFGLSPMIADLNGDGFDDIAISAQFVNGMSGERKRSGEVYVYWGSLRSVMSAKGGTAERADLTMVGAAGDAIASALVPVDVTGDGRPELVLGAPEASGLGEESTLRGRIYITPAELLRAR